MKFKNAVDHANELLAEKAALEARVKVLGVENLALRESLDATEAELERLKAQEPVAYRWEGKSSGNICYDGIKPLGVISQPLYAEPRPAVLPEMTYQGAKGLFNYLMTEEELNATVSGYNQAIADAKALSCQPRFVVKLPQRLSPCASGYGYSLEANDNGDAYSCGQVVEAIRAAGGEIAE